MLFSFPAEEFHKITQALEVLTDAAARVSWFFITTIAARHGQTCL